jgi:hypothetical protein
LLKQAGGIVLALQSVALSEDALLLCDNESVLCVIKKWVGQGGKATLATEQRRSLYELRRRLRQVGEAYGEVRKPRCRRRYNRRFKG